MMNIFYQHLQCEYENYGWPTTLPYYSYWWWNNINKFTPASSMAPWTALAMCATPGRCSFPPWKLAVNSLCWGWSSHLLVGILVIGYHKLVYTPKYWVWWPSPFYMEKMGVYPVLIGKDFLFGGFQKTPRRRTNRLQNAITHWPTVYHCIVLYGHTIVSSKHSLHKKSIEEKHPYGHITGPYGWKETRYHVTFRKYGPT